MKKTTNSNANGFDDTIRTMATNFTNKRPERAEPHGGGANRVHHPGGFADSHDRQRARGGTAGGAGRAGRDPATRKARGRRLARRTPQDINRALERVVGILSARKEPLGAEHIRAEFEGTAERAAAYPSRWAGVGRLRLGRREAGDPVQPCGDQRGSRQEDRQGGGEG